MAKNVSMARVGRRQWEVTEVPVLTACNFLAHTLGRQNGTGAWGLVADISVSSHGPSSDAELHRQKRALRRTRESLGLDPHYACGQVLEGGEG